MVRKFSVLLMFVFSLLISCAFFQTSTAIAKTTRKVDTPGKDLQAKLDKLLKLNESAGARIGMIVSDLSTNQMIYEYHADKLMTPASNLKVVTSAAALGILGPEYTFSTGIYCTGERVDSILQGDIYLKGGGDPYLVMELLWKLSQSVAALGIKEVTGSLIADASFFDRKGYPHSDWKRIKMPLWYNAPTGGLAFNFNAVGIHVQPGKKVGDKPQISIEPRSRYFVLENNAVTGSSSKNSLIFDLKEVDGRCHLYLKGSIPKDYATQKYYRHIKDSTAYCANTFLDYLAQSGVTVKGEYREGITPEDAQELVVQESRPLSMLLRDANKYSNNFMMEQTLKVIGAVQNEPPGTTQKGIDAVLDYLNSIAIDVTDCTMTDGSGLSRKNEIKPRTLNDVIQYSVSRSTFFPEFLNALPIAGVDGTLKKRLNHNPAHRLVRAKTGFINGVSCLSGIIDGRSGRGLVFSIMFNRAYKLKTQAKTLQNRLVSQLLEYWKTQVEK